MKTEKLNNFEGYLFAKLELIHSKSEGPAYFLEMWDYKEIRVIKQVQRWENDPNLHPLLGKKVTINGELNEEGIVYTSIAEQVDSKNDLILTLSLGLEDNTLWVNPKPAPPHLPWPSDFPPSLKEMKIKFSVQWPFRSIWRGKVPTTQLFDIWIEGPRGREIWQWSEEMLFKTTPTKVVIPGGSPQTLEVSWHYEDRAILEEGRYLVRARFLPSGQEVRKSFTVRFVEIKETVESI